MLRSHGRLTRSLSFQPCTTAANAVRRAYSAKKGDGDSVAAAEVEAPAKRTRMIRSLGMIEATGLAQIQAELEESGYKGKRKSRRESTEEGEAKESKPRKRAAAKSVTKASSAVATTTKKQSRKKAAADSKESSPKDPGPERSRRRREQKRVATTIPPRLLPPDRPGHHDLASFLNHAKLTKLSTTSTVYKGTHFEYTVADALHSYDFNLHRTGRSNDLGIDLVGRWQLPEMGSIYEGMPVLMQCKFSKPTPAMVRELEGVYSGAPAGWQGDGVLAILISTHASTEGVRAACQRSRWPLGVMQITKEGEVKQFIWNAVAANAGLEGLGVAVRYKTGKPLSSNSGAAAVGQTIVLTWMGKPWRPPGVRKNKMFPAPAIATDTEEEPETIETKEKPETVEIEQKPEQEESGEQSGGESGEESGEEPAVELAETPAFSPVKNNVEH